MLKSRVCAAAEENCVQENSSSFIKATQMSLGYSTTCDYHRKNMASEC